MTALRRALARHRANRAALLAHLDRRVDPWAELGVLPPGEES